MVEEKKLIEMVCSHNHGRSVPAGDIGRLHLIRIGKDKDYGVISSGSRVDEIEKYMRREIPIPSREARWCIEAGVRRRIFDTKQEDIEKLLGLKN